MQATGSRQREMPVHALVQAIAAGRIESASVSVSDRRRCVESLTRIGYTVAEMADVLGVTERTIKRDRAAIRRAIALAAREEQRDELVGEYRDLTLESIQRLRRICNDADAPAQVRLGAEKQLTHAMREYVATSASLPAEPMQFMPDEQFLAEARAMLEEAGRASENRYGRKVIRDEP